MPLIGVELQPAVDEGQIRVSLELEPGTRIGVTDDTMQRMASIVRELVPAHAPMVPNDFGLHHMHGNVSEWCADGLPGGRRRFLRGGNWMGSPYLGHSTYYENRAAPSSAARDIGLRPIRALDL